MPKKQPGPTRCHPNSPLLLPHISKPATPLSPSSNIRGSSHSAVVQAKIAVLGREDGMRTLSSEKWTLAIHQSSPTTRLYSLHSNRPVCRPSQDAWYIALIALVCPFVAWPSIPAIFLVSLIIGWIHKKLTTVISESVLILGPLGIQITSTNLMGVTHRFVAREHLLQAIIHESIDGWNIVFYLALVIEPEGGQVYTHQVFTGLKPPLMFLIPVWEGIREVLFGEDKCIGG